MAQLPGLVSSDDENPPLFFSMPNAPYGDFCSCHASTFTVPKKRISMLVGRSCDPDNQFGDKAGNMTFGCAEQFMVFCKAARFHDREIQRRVMATDSPKEQMRLEKLICGFNGFWNPIKSSIAVTGNMAKFSQNNKLKRKLLATGDRMLVKAAPTDQVWGIGYAEKQALSCRLRWGENRLGKALMEVRKRLQDEPGDGVEYYTEMHVEIL